MASNKIRKALLASAVVAPLMFFASSRVLGLTDLPVISTACEDKTGKLYSFDDGFSIFDKCEGTNRRVILIGEKGDKGDKGDPGEQGLQGLPGPKGDQGEPGIQGDQGIQSLQGIQGFQGIPGIQGEQGVPGEDGISGAGNIAFIYWDRPYNDVWALTTNKEVWIWYDTDTHWNRYSMYDVPMDTSQIVQWQFSSFLDKDGNIWANIGGTWRNVNHP